jgi:hypothetical protein
MAGTVLRVAKMDPSDPFSEARAPKQEVWIGASTTFEVASEYYAVMAVFIPGGQIIRGCDTT